VRLARRPAAVVFDCDGLLVETETIWGEAERRVLAARGRTWTAEVKRAMLGRSGTAAGETLASFAGVDPARADELMEELNATFAAVLAERDVEPMPGAVALVERLAAAGLPLAVASNAPQAIVPAVLARVGLRDRFAHVVCAGGALRSKPAPDVYSEACRRLGAAPAASVALEDSPTGVQAARAAGLATIAVPSLVRHLGADLEVGSLLDLADVVARWLERQG
jgi:HAD superfamily hydrolase (TIGR01509 family)